MQYNIPERNLTLLWLDLVDPSTTNNFFKGNLRDEASFSILSLSSPSGSYLLQQRHGKENCYTKQETECISSLQNERMKILTGVNLLKSGAIRIGYSVIITIDRININPQR